MANIHDTTLKSVLITSISTLSEAAMAVPVVYPVCEANSHVNFVLVTTAEAQDIFVNRPANLIVLDIDPDKYDGITGPIKLARNLQHRYAFNAVANLHDDFRTMLMKLVLKRKGVVVATVDQGSKMKNTGNSKSTTPTVHMRYQAVFRQLGLKTRDDFASIYGEGDAPRSAMVPVKEQGERWIAIAPFASHKGKQYPLEQMQLVIAELSRWEHSHIFLLGNGTQERDALDPIMRRYNNVISVPHIKHSMADELSLLSHCDLMLTMDSAWMHLASLVGLPVVSVWGANHPACGFLGWHQALRDTVQLDELDCRPCSRHGNKKCRYGDYHCLRDISPELILDKVKTILQR